MDEWQTQAGGGRGVKKRWMGGVNMNKGEQKVAEQWQEWEQQQQQPQQQPCPFVPLFFA